MSTNAELFAHAEHCLRTGQPNLANLYMCKLIGQVQADRRQIRKDWYAARKATRGPEAFAAVVEELVEVFTEALQPLFHAVTSVSGALGEWAEAVEKAAQDDYALASDN